MTGVWEWVITVSAALTVAAILGGIAFARGLERRVQQLADWAFGLRGENGMRRDFPAFQAEYRAQHEALAKDMRERFHDARGETHRLGLDLEERIRALEQRRLGGKR